MKIVVVTQNCFPYISPRSNRATELAKEFVRQGHDVTLYALLGDVDYFDFCENTGVKVKNLGKSKYGLLDNGNRRNNNPFYKLVSRYLGNYFDFPKIELMPLTSKALGNEGRIDMLVTIAHPHTIHWGAAKYIKKHRDKVGYWIADCGDPYMLNPGTNYPRYFEYVEKYWCKLCDSITIPIEEAKKAYYPEFADKIEIIPQGFDFENNKLADYKPNDVPTFAFAGLFYKDLRDPVKFLEYLTTVKSGFRFIIYTKDTPYNRGTFSLDKYQAKLGEKLVIRNFIPREQLLFELSGYDFVVNIRNKSTVQQPSKLIDYALAKRPILEITSDFNEDSVLEDFLVGNYERQTIVPDIERYNIRNVVGNMLSLVKPHDDTF